MTQRCIILLFILFCFACKNNRLPYRDLTPEELEQDRKNHECAYTGKYSLIERQSMYPYKDASEVLLVSFDTLEGDHLLHTLPMLNNEVNLAALSENVELSRSGIDSLTDILFNLGYSGDIFKISGTGCYDPLNAILFADKGGKIFEYMEICFHCSGTKVSSERIEFGERCWGKFDALRDLFKSNGIKIGVVEEN